MHKLQEEYLFLVNHDIHSAEELGLVAVIVAAVAGIAAYKAMH